MPRRLGLLLIAATLALPGLASAREIYVSNEKGNTITIVDGDKLEVKATVPVGNRPRNGYRATLVPEDAAD